MPLINRYLSNKTVIKIMYRPCAKVRQGSPLGIVNVYEICIRRTLNFLESLPLRSTLLSDFLSLTVNF